ncbi:MAG: hybrid sensor histidine kinase/response regulator [Anaerolineae bacterium]|nr:hybrid sensor histidine kinase/response regulator [Anaerolineae bacterium]
MQTQQPPTDNLTGTILVVDDSLDAITTLAAQLELEGFTAIPVDNGSAALDIVRSSPPDLVIMDVMMPGLTGMEVLQSIRANPPTAELPVILLTALDAPQDVVRGLELGASDYVTKPPQFEVLVARVRTQMKIKRLQSEQKRDLRQLQELDVLRNKFMRIAAHDLKSPLNNITLGIQILEQYGDELKQVDPDILQILETIDSAASLMLSIINGFLDFQAIQAGKLTLNTQLTQLNDVIESVLQQFRPYANRKGITLQADLTKKMPKCMADPDRLMQVVNNLLSNAIKFSPKRSSVIVRTSVNGAYLRTEIEDHGPGIPAEDLPLLFQEFSKLKKRADNAEAGSGLGLSIARNMVELHSGQIGVESTVGDGSTFWFELPHKGATT